MYSRDVSVVVVGDERCGKSTLIDRFIWNEVSSSYKPTSFDKFSVKKIVNNEEVSFTIWDTSGAQAYDSVRPLSYNEADIFMLCFSVADPCTLTNVRDHWIPEIKRHRPDAPILLTGCMARQRDDPSVSEKLREVGLSPVTPDQAMQICAEVGISIYVDTSAQEGVKEVLEAFDMAAILTLQERADRMDEERQLGRPASVGSGQIQPSRHSSGPGRPSSAASGRSGSALGFTRSAGPGPNNQGTSKRSSGRSCGSVGKVSNSNSFHGSYSNIPENLVLTEELDLVHTRSAAVAAPVHKQTRSLDSPAGETIHENEILDSASSNGTRSPRSLQKKSRPQSPLARNQPASPPSSPAMLRNPTNSLPTSPSNIPARPYMFTDRQGGAEGQRTRSNQSTPLADHSRNMAGASLQQALLLTGGQLENLSVESNQSAPRKFEPSQSEARVVRGEFQRQNSTPGATSSSHQFTRQISNVSQQLALAGGGGGGSPDLDFRNRAGGPERNSHKPNYRASLPAGGRPPLPLAPALPKSPSDLAAAGTPISPIVQEPLPRRLAHLGVPDGKNYESLKSHSSTVSHGSTGSKLSTASSLSGNGMQYYSGPRDFDIPDTEDPEMLKKLDFVSPKTGVYRPAHPNKGAGSKKDKCSLM